MSKKKKKGVERKRSLDLLREWQRERLERDRDLPLPAYGPAEVTVVAPFVVAADEAEVQFPFLECAVRETWRNCGFLRTVILTNASHPVLEAFASQFGLRVEVVVVKSLVPGDAETLSRELSANLADRFRTSWALLIRDDAFPVRYGLGSYLDGTDFIGAPGMLRSWWSAGWAALRNSFPMNGAFSLRSMALCKLASEQWKARYEGRAFDKSMQDGTFQTKTLPASSRSYRKAVHFPDVRDAQSFAYDGNGNFHGTTLPFGFVGAAAFRVLLDKGLV